MKNDLLLYIVLNSTSREQTILKFCNKEVQIRLLVKFALCLVEDKATRS